MMTTNKQNGERERESLHGWMPILHFSSTSSCWPGLLFDVKASGSAVNVRAVKMAC